MVTITADEESVVDDLLSLREELIDGGLGAHVSLRQRPMEPGALGPITDAVIAVVTSGALATALASVLVTWIKFRVGDRELTITRDGDVKIRLRATNVRQADDAELRALFQELTTFFEKDALLGLNAEGDGVTSDAASRADEDEDLDE
ncbi:effector-associated constant component EACC1 [Phytohabitans aurantiacus]|uniref:DUF4342 domain-containing protein n=1 Tax=Phytohabitans aurantiacus TaxID=3016789 RepID=A0ABQ5RBJ1_9ACTN|nr:hypothetical protein [Phytohabitans aurantiacus]GLI03365.1 hypothetical protein Pa4123_86430 [Phytohabitans aurantiacus]